MGRGNKSLITKSGSHDHDLFCFVLFSCYSHQSISDYSWEVYIVHSGVFAATPIYGKNHSKIFFSRAGRHSDSDSGSEHV